MNLKQLNEIFAHRITGGSEYGWRCFPNARFIDYESAHADVSVVFSTVSQEIYEATVTSKDSATKHCYRWMNPDYKSDHDAEAKERGVDGDIAWDDVKWVTLEVDDDFLDKAEAVFNGVAFDERIQVPLTITDDEFTALAKMAHERDITFNEMVSFVLQKVIDESAV